MKNVILSILLSIIAAYVTVQFIKPHETKMVSQETAYERVMRTKTLRCGWFAEPPFTNVDFNSNEKTGIVADIVNKFADDYDVKIEWVTISNFAMMGEDLKQGKYDAICASLFNMPRGGLVDAVDPFVYMSAYGYVRSDETRIRSLDQLNNAEYRIAGQEGAAVTAVAREKFPDAQFHIIPSAELSEMLESVAVNKADVAFMIPSFYEQFSKANPGVLKPLDPDHPLQTFVLAFGVKPEEEGLKSLFNSSLHRMMASGELAQIFARYDPSGGLSYPMISRSGKQ
jgi:ABC-type amino acid transport substrate-binding protein